MNYDALIIGAGLAGLVAAQIIQSGGKSVLLLEKEPHIGGRLATQSVGRGLADLGAQFFTVRTDVFRQQVDQWLNKKLVSIWGYGWSDGSLKHSVNDGHPRYYARGGMAKIAQALSQSLQHVEVNAGVDEIHRAKDRWEIKLPGGASYASKLLIITPPVPQSLELLKTIPLGDTDLAELKRIRFDPCICVTFAIDGAVNLPEPGALQNHESAVYWMADNMAKGISPGERTITLHAGGIYSRQNYDASDDSILAFFRTEFAPYLAEDATIRTAMVKRWPYSVPITTYPRDILKAIGFPLIFAGDAFGGRGRVEGAYLSGHAAGIAALSLL